MDQNTFPQPGMPPQKKGHGCLVAGLISAVIALLVFGGIGLLVIGPLYLQASGAQNVNETVNNLNALQGQISQLYSSQENYGTAPMTQTLIQAGIAPANMVMGRGSNASLRNAWGGLAEVMPTGEGSGYRISLHDVPQDACISVLTKLGGGSYTSFRGVSVEANGVPTADNPQMTPPINISQALNACASEQVNGISLYYR